MKTKLYIVAYDISDAKRRKRIQEVIKQFTSGGQKSVFECYLSASEKNKLQQALNLEIDTHQDALLIARVSSNATIYNMATASQPMDEDYLWLG